MDLSIRYDSVETFGININDFLSNRGIAVIDITEAIFSAKHRAIDADEDAVVAKTLGNGVVFGFDGSGNDIAVVNFSHDDYGPGKLEIGGSYVIGLGIKTPSHTKWLEAKWQDEEPRLTIYQEFFRA